MPSRGSPKTVGRKFKDLPEVWYHGTYHRLPSDLDLLGFDRQRGTADLNAEGPGWYFTTSLKDAQKYGPYLYTATLSPQTRLLISGSVTSKKTILDQVLKLYRAASADQKETYLSNFDVSMPALASDVTKILSNVIKYTPDLHKAMVLLYHDLFSYHSASYVVAARCIADAIVVRQPYKLHLIVLSPAKVTLQGPF